MGVELLEVRDFLAQHAPFDMLPPGGAGQGPAPMHAALCPPRHRGPRCGGARRGPVRRPVRGRRCRGRGRWSRRAGRNRRRVRDELTAGGPGRALPLHGLRGHPAAGPATRALRGAGPRARRLRVVLCRDSPRPVVEGDRQPPAGRLRQHGARHPGAGPGDPRAGGHWAGRHDRGGRSRHVAGGRLEHPCGRRGRPHWHRDRPRPA